ncbi:MAG: transketolase [Clostridia bacterium]|nr:transketolase [Clostridia bacterium]
MKGDFMELTEIAREVRKDILLQVYSAQSGHPGGALSCADLLTSIYFDLINEGDKVVLSKGHASPALYAVLAEKGFFPKEELTTFRKINSHLQGHPSLLKTNGVDASSGSLGQGLSIANGMALAFKMDNKPNTVYAILGDGELQEGQIWEAAMTANQYRLNNLIVFVDYNKLQIDGSNDEVMQVAPVKEKFEAFGFFAQEIDGHNFEAIREAVMKAKAQEKPSVIVANTIKGKGVLFMENQVSWHGKAPNKEQYEKAVKEL